MHLQRRRCDLRIQELSGQNLHQAPSQNAGRHDRNTKTGPTFLLPTTPLVPHGNNHHRTPVSPRSVSHATSRSLKLDPRTGRGCVDATLRPPPRSGGTACHVAPNRPATSRPLRRARGRGSGTVLERSSGIARARVPGSGWGHSRSRSGPAGRSGRGGSTLGKMGRGGSGHDRRVVSRARTCGGEQTRQPSKHALCAETPASRQSGRSHRSRASRAGPWHRARRRGRRRG